MIRLALPTVLLLSSVSLAVETPRECARIVDDASRLACFDSFYPCAGSVSEEMPWTTSTTDSDFDGEPGILLRTISLQEVPGPYGSDAPGELRLQCEEGSTSIDIAFGRNFMSSMENQGDVSYRINDGPTAIERMVQSPDHRSLGLREERRSVPFIKKLFGSERLQVSAAPFGEEPVAAEFNITGLEQAIQPLREACGW